MGRAPLPPPPLPQKVIFFIYVAILLTFEQVFFSLFLTDKIIYAIYLIQFFFLLFNWMESGNLIQKRQSGPPKNH